MFNHFFKKFAIASITFMLSACAGGIGDYRTPGVDQRVVFGPLPQNNYTGRLVEYDQATTNELNSRAVEICSQLGGVKSLPAYSYSVPIGWKVSLYQCNGPPPTSPAPLRNWSAPTGPTVQILPAAAGLDEAKSKCFDLGFLAGSESFGSCVLKLSK
jgi:hypothetical protein